MKFKTFLILILGLAFSVLIFVSNAQTSLLPDVEAERAKYCPTITKAEASEILNTVAWNNRSDGWGLSGKTGGSFCPFATGTIACDILHHQPSNIIVDVFGSSPDDDNPIAPANPMWLVRGQQTQSNRPWVAPVQPSSITPRDCSLQPPPQPPPNNGQPPGPPPTNGSNPPQILGADPNTVKPGQQVVIIGVDLTEKIQLDLSTGGSTLELAASLNPKKTRATITLPANIAPGSYFVTVIGQGGTAVHPNLFTVSEATQPTSSSQTQPPRNFGELIQSIFRWALALVGVAIFVNFLWAGFLWFTAAGRPGPISEAKEKMTNALIGAIILLASYLILKTINPDLVRQTFTLPGL